MALNSRNRDICLVVGANSDLVTDACQLASEVLEVRVETVMVADRDWASVFAQIERERPSLVILCASWSASEAIEAVPALEMEARDYIIVGSGEDPTLILNFMRSGAADFVPLAEVQTELRQSLLRLSSNSRESTSAGALVSTIGVKGGVGATVTTCQLAFNLSASGARVAILDLAFPTGDVALYCDLELRVTIGDLARGGVPLERSAVLDALALHAASGVEIIAAPVRIEDYELILPSHVDLICQVLQERFDWVLVDLPRTWTPIAGQVADRSDQVLLALAPDASSLSHAAEQVELCRRIGISESAIRLILCREDADGALPKSEIQKLIGRGPDACLPNDFAGVSGFVNEGRQLSMGLGRGKLSEAYGALAKDLMTWQGIEVNEDSRESGGSLARWARRIFQGDES